MISYYNEDISFTFKGKTFNNRWLRMVAESEIRRIGDLSIIFCSDNYILDVNMRYLQHDYSVRENAVLYGAEFEEELNRVMVHGLLHLIGYDDHTEEEQKTMREKEDYYLSLRKSLNA